MLDFISIYLFGAITVTIPAVIWYLHRMGTKYVADCVNARQGLENSIKELNQLHNNALATHKTLETRLIKLETANAVQNYGGLKK